jgi:hypothetical protein
MFILYLGKYGIPYFQMIRAVMVVSLLIYSVKMYIVAMSDVGLK